MDLKNFKSIIEGEVGPRQKVATDINFDVSYWLTISPTILYRFSAPPVEKLEQNVVGVEIKLGLKNRAVTFSIRMYSYK